MSGEVADTITLERPDELEPFLAAIARAPAVSKSPTVGDVIDERYALTAMLGRGGMGVVFEARDLRTERIVALKWMSKAWALGSEEERHAAATRFLREARIAARVTHPNVVGVFDVKVDHETPYLVMERLRGETLRARLERGVLSWDEAVSVLTPVLRGLAALHRAGIVHRDLKPENIFLCDPRNDEGVTTKILDFGISHVAASDAEGLTRTGTTLGTPAYMPLEQLRATREVRATADVYALGVVLYECLSGARPFESSNAADHAILLATSRPRPLSELVPTLSRSRVSAVMRAIARAPEDRFDTVDSLAAALAQSNGANALRFRWAGAALCVLVLLASWAISRARAPLLPEVHSPAQAAPERRVLPFTPPARAEYVPAASEPPASVAPAEPASSPGLTRSRVRRARTEAVEDVRPVPITDRAIDLRPEDFR